MEPYSGPNRAASADAANTFVILNTASGSAERLSGEVESLLSGNAEVLKLVEPSELEAKVAEALRRGAKRLVIAGGDGSVHSGINCLAPKFSQVEFAILPFGTGNDLARAIGVPVDDMPAAVELALRGTARPADIVEFRSSEESAPRHFVNMCYGGFGERVADEMNQETKKSWGLIPYWISLLKRTISLPEYELQLESEHGTLSARVHGVLAANSCFLGGGVPAAPQARIDDGRMDIAVLPAQSGWGTLAAVVELVRGQLHESERVLTFRTSRLTLRTQPEWKYTTDGEAAPGGTVTLTALPGALRLVSKADAPAFVDL